MDTTFSAPLIFLNADGLISGWSEGAERLLGWSAAEVIGQPYAKVFDDLDFFIAVDGPMDLEWLSVPAPDGGRVIAIRTMKTKQLLERFDLTMSNSEIIGTWNWNIAGDMISADSRFAKAFGLEIERARSGVPLQVLLDIIHPQDRDRVAADLARAVEVGGSYNGEFRIVRPDGTVSDVAAKGRLIDGKGRAQPRFPGVLFDITARKAAEREAFHQRERYRNLFEILETGFCVIRMIWDADGEPVDYEFLEVNKAFTRHTGIEDPIGKRMRRDVAPAHEQHWFEIYGKVAKTGEAVSFENPAAAIGDRWFQVQAFPIDGTGSDNVAVLFSDTTASKRAEIALRTSEEEFRTLSQSMLNHVWTATPDGQIDWLNDRVLDFSGLGQQELTGDRWGTIVHPEDFPAAAASWADALERQETYQAEFRVRRHDGSYRWHVVRATPVKNEEGEVRRWVGTNTDIEHAKMNEAALAELNDTLEQRIEERTQQLLQSQKALQQSQKMETIGKLTGGVAHDFNNLLQVIAGNLQLLGKDVAGNAGAEIRVKNALAGVHRGAKLASQLLAFARRQPLEPKVINVGRFIQGMGDLLHRSIGETIEIDTIIGNGLWNTSADPTQVENAILNLAINARDAMNGTGQLTIEVGNTCLDETYVAAYDDVRSGDYVLIAVSDTGTGMSRETMEQAFEPFFSTKAEGKGTGLGLSMVYGFVKQSGGHVNIYSEIGHGTTVKLYLPRAMAEEERETPHQTGAVIGGTETILVVEDDDEVRATVVATLSDLGYKVLTARDAEAGLAVIESGAEIDLLFTDVVMPGTLKSPEMVKLATTRLPGLAVLFTSGYTENSIVHGGKLDAGVELLSKPYTREALDHRIRLLLDGRRRDPAPQQPAPATVAVVPARSEPQAETGKLTVLLVEDEALIRINTCDVLEDMGHRVIEAGTAAEALKAMTDQQIDILVTDVGLPDMRGGELARKVRQIKPAVGVIFATGDSELPEGADSDAVLLMKPYSDEALHKAIAQVLPATEANTA
ncbi:PAS domain S-box protein [Hoeflea sp. Naph1]|uniref:PAS domain S-box protein n=1 Tax=Hoeflea sp. Naph1 TaxID=3388653 RepID=UPI0039903440